jgi:hypothetical protein
LELDASGNYKKIKYSENDLFQPMIIL